MRKRKDIYWGLVFILAGLTIILNITGVFAGYDIFKIAWSVIFISLAINSLINYHFFHTSLFLAILAHINAATLGIENHIGSIYAAFLLIGAGLSRIMHKRKKRYGPSIYVNGEKKNFSDFKDTYTSEEHGDVLNFENNFGSSVRYVKSNNLKYARIENNLGTSRVYFDEATFSEDGAVIHAECNLGNIVLYFPSNINLQNNLSTSLASIKGSRSFHNDDSYPTVFLEGEANLGEIEVIIL